jgi:hypothetical protein
MCRTSLFLIPVLLAQSVTSLTAQTKSTAPLPRQTLAAERSWVQFGVVLGRLQVLNSQVGQTLSAHQEDPESGVRESFSINAAAEQTVVHYELLTPDLQLLIHFSGPDDVRIEKTPQSAAGGSYVSLRQPARGTLEMVVGRGPEACRYRAASFWHLMLEHRDVCRTQLLPILDSLRDDWQLEETTDEIQAALLRFANARRLPETDRWALLVRTLSHGSFQQRQSAERQLRQSGQAVVAYLTTLNPHRLDTEQRERIRRIVLGLVTRTDDTPQRVALWLNGDHRVWLTLISQGDPPTRQLSAEHLARLRGESVQTAAVPISGVRR